MGNSPAYVADRELLKQQKSQGYYGSLSGKPLFQYDEKRDWLEDQAKRINNTYQIGTRLMGVIQAGLEPEKSSPERACRQLELRAACNLAAWLAWPYRPVVLWRWPERTMYEAVRALPLQASRNTHEERNRSQSSSASIGVSFGGGAQNGVSITVGMSKGKSEGQGQRIETNLNLT